MKNMVIIKQVDKLTGDYQEFKYKSFESLDEKAKVIKSILAFIDKSWDSESIIQIENFKEHDIQELNIF